MPSTAGAQTSGARQSNGTVTRHAWQGGLIVVSCKAVVRRPIDPGIPAQLGGARRAFADQADIACTSEGGGGEAGVSYLRIIRAKAQYPLNHCSFVR